jgi:phenylacetate-CoA ligase
MPPADNDKKPEKMRSTSSSKGQRTWPAMLPTLKFSSASPQHKFPVLPDESSALLLSILAQLEQSQWWEPDQIYEQQFLQLATLLKFVHKSIPFYRQRLAQAGIHTARDFDHGDWEQIPVLTRQQLQAGVQTLRVRKPPPGHRQLGMAQTSGSTGTPVRVATTETTRMLWNAFVLREHYWHGRDFSATLAAIRHFGDKVNAAYPDGTTLPDWGAPVNLLHASGPAVALDIHTDPCQQLEWLYRKDPEYLITFPSNAAALAQHSQIDGVSLQNLREVRLVSEAVDEELRASLQDAWGVTVTDTYSAQETGTLALQCPEHAAYHVQSENILLEVVDANGHACKPGETGRVLVTTLHNFAMPLIRYEIGDYATVGETCNCGRGLPVLTHILGRVRNMLVLPSGEAHWPNLAATFYRQAAPVIQHQLVQHDLEHLEARLVVERPLTVEEEAALRTLIVERIGHPFSVQFSYPERIERSRSGKYEEFVSHVTQYHTPA